MRTVVYRLAIFGAVFPAAFAAAFAAILGGAGCTASSEEVRPPNNELFFPTGAAIDPDDSVMFVTNANSELRYDSGSIAVFTLTDIERFVRDRAAGLPPPDGCTQDGDHIETLECPEELLLNTTAQAGVRIGNFATDLAVQDIGPASGGRRNLRLIVPTRGDPSIAWIDWDADNQRLSCKTGSEGFGLCDDSHRLSFVLNDADLLSLPEEPFGVFADSSGEFAMVSHLTTGAVTLIDSPAGGDAMITDVVATAFQPDPSSGLRGATGIVGNPLTDMVYVGSRSEDRIQTFTVGRPVNGAPPFLLMGGWFFLDDVGGNNGNSSDTRGMAFSANGERLYLVNRRPPSLQIYDTSTGPTGAPRNKAVGATDLCRQASTITVAGIGDDERVYITCFQDGQLYIIDPRGEGMVEDIVTVGRGPYAVTASPGKKLLFVTNFLEDTIAVLDIDPVSPMRNRVVLRIGEPRQP